MFRAAYLYYIIPLLYEEKEYIHQEEIMYSVCILELRKHSMCNMLKLPPLRGLRLNLGLFIIHVMRHDHHSSRQGWLQGTKNDAKVSFK